MKEYKLINNWKVDSVEMNKKGDVLNISLMVSRPGAPKMEVARTKALVGDNRSEMLDRLLEQAAKDHPRVVAIKQG